MVLSNPSTKNLVLEKQITLFPLIIGICRNSKSASCPVAACRRQSRASSCPKGTAGGTGHQSGLAAMSLAGVSAMIFRDLVAFIVIYL